MSETWHSTELRNLADVRISNVDKKTYPAERPVKLCNYMDVYSNDYLTSQIPFMQASASLQEIERFALRRGDVIITKDSETPDDIGIAAVLTEDIEHLICGYHLHIKIGLILYFSLSNFRHRTRPDISARTLRVRRAMAYRDQRLSSSKSLFRP
jgi:hypothetical protein